MHVGRALFAVAAIVVVAAVVCGPQPREDRWQAVHSVTRDSMRGARIAAPPGIRQATESAAWCGTPSPQDVTPNVVSGYPTHWIYAAPSVEADGFTTYANVMQSDAESIDDWWRSQDPTRMPRNDLAQFSCGTQLDLTQIRLSQSGAELSGEDTRFVRIAEALVALGFDSPHTKYVVHYDGPGHPDICGEGGSHEDGYGYAIVYVRACAGVPSSSTAAHELLHTLGAVPAGAPHDCPQPNDGHVCDDSYDLMFPFGDETPIGDLSLDTGRDDYYAHAGPHLDIQDSPWLVQLDRQTPLALSITGRGSVTADLPGLHCTKSCSTAWNAGTALVLTAEPGKGVKLVRWGAASCSAASDCSVSLTRTTNLSVLFAPITFRLTVAVSGRGTVRSPQTRIACPGRCASVASSYVPVRLTAKPVKGWRFRGWSGSCRGRAPVCTVPMTADADARAIFTRAA
jgi:hypothetical protein